jgi:hypothetical protein
MCQRRWLVLLLILTFAGLRALAAASPPDPLWLPGVYDDADHDDVVLAALALVGSRDDAPATVGRPARLVAAVDALTLVSPRPVSKGFQETRAPPVS